MATYRMDHDSEQDFLHALTNFDEHLVNFRLWAKDKNLFTNSNEDKFLDWLDEPQRLARGLVTLNAIYDDITAHNFSDIVLLGMGGSSLSPMVFKAQFARDARFYILDTIHPSAIKRLLARID